MFSLLEAFPQPSRALKIIFTNPKIPNSQTRLIKHFISRNGMKINYFRSFSSALFLCILSLLYVPALSFAEKPWTDPNSESSLYSHSLPPLPGPIAPLPRAWGQIVDSPSGPESHYCEKDLVYIKCSDTKRGMLREGDRFGIVATPTDPSLSRSCGSLSDDQSRILGRIEITSVGVDLILGIIVECRTAIHNGYQITPIPQTTTQLPSHLEAEAITRTDGHTS
jgi:hypothetical protein